MPYKSKKKTLLTSKSFFTANLRSTWIKSWETIWKRANNERENGIWNKKDLNSLRLLNMENRRVWNFVGFILPFNSIRFGLNSSKTSNHSDTHSIGDHRVIYFLLIDKFIWERVQCTAVLCTTNLRWTEKAKKSRRRKHLPTNKWGLPVFRITIAA